MEITDLIAIIDKYYPKNIVLNNPELLNQISFSNLKNICLEAYNDQDQWKMFLNEIKSKFDIEITEFVLLNERNPSFIAVFLTENYERPKPVGYEPLQLVLKLSVIAPVYTIYFDNLASDWNKRLIRTNPITKQETSVFNQIRENMDRFYSNYSKLDFINTFYTLSHLGDISNQNKRKPYLDECIFGLYLSIHPHNIFTDKLGEKSKPMDI